MKKLTIAQKIQLYFINRAYRKLQLRLNTCDYEVYLNTDHWKFFSSEKRKNAKFKCEKCNHKGIEIHHLNYLNRGHETFNDVLCLCHDCHMNIHNNKPAHLDNRFKTYNQKAYR